LALVDARVRDTGWGVCHCAFAVTVRGLHNAAVVGGLPVVAVYHIEACEGLPDECVGVVQKILAIHGRLGGASHHGFGWGRFIGNRLGALTLTPSRVDAHGAIGSSHEWVDNEDVLVAAHLADACTSRIPRASWRDLRIAVVFGDDKSWPPWLIVERSLKRSLAV